MDTEFQPVPHPDPARARNRSPVYLHVRDGHTIADAHAALRTLLASGQPHLFRLKRKDGGLTVVYKGVDLPWLQIGYAPPSTPPDAARDASEIRRIMGGNCHFLDDT